MTLLVLQERVALNKEPKGFVLAYASLETSSCPIETHLSQGFSLNSRCRALQGE